MSSNMEVDHAPVSEKSPVKALGVGITVVAGGGGSVSVSLHPLVIMNVSEHWTRRTAQEGKPVQGDAPLKLDPFLQCFVFLVK